MFHSCLKWQGIKSLQNDKNIITKVKHKPLHFVFFQSFSIVLCLIPFPHILLTHRNTLQTKKKGSNISVFYHEVLNSTLVTTI